jgi:hypothetical protein
MTIPGESVQLLAANILNVEQTGLGSYVYSMINRVFGLQPKKAGLKRSGQLTESRYCVSRLSCSVKVLLRKGNPCLRQIMSTNKKFIKS